MVAPPRATLILGSKLYVKRFVTLREASVVTRNATAPLVLMPDFPKEVPGLEHFGDQMLGIRSAGIAWGPSDPLQLDEVVRQSYAGAVEGMGEEVQQRQSRRSFFKGNFGCIDHLTVMVLLFKNRDKASTYSYYFSSS